jgi:hypothetical protein
MKGDFSRFTFDARNRFSRILFQQGRVQLDSDLNELNDILLHYLRMLATDLIGPHGGPEGELGFEIVPLPKKESATELADFTIGTGRYYVDGLLCENEQAEQRRWGGGMEIMFPGKQHGEHMEEGEEDAQSETDEAEPKEMERIGLLESVGPTSYFNQSGYPLSGPEARDRDLNKLPKAPFLVYLDVWEREVSAVEEPGIREVALGGPDTAARSQIIWQVKAVGEALPPNPDDLKCETFEDGQFWQDFRDRWQPQMRGGMAAKALEPDADESTDPCIISPDARFRGEANQLYRVEIHTGSDNSQSDPPTFKWSRDNGSNVFPILSVKDRVLYLEHLGRDERSGLQAGDWVEIVNSDYVLVEAAQPLYKVDSVESTDMTVTLKKAPTAQVGRNAILRRWDQRAGVTQTGGLRLSEKDNAALASSDWQTLEDGIQIRFRLSPNARYRTGDYWLIPARTATGDIEWPRIDGLEPQMLPPRGVEHHYAPLAGIYFGDYKDKNGNNKTGFHAIDLRHVFPALAKCLVP